MTKAIDFYTDLGRFATSAKHHVTIAEIYGSELNDSQKAVTHYETAAQYFKGEQSVANANKCLLYVANYSALNHNYQKAIDIYEEIGKYCIDSPLLKYSAKDHFFRAALCHTCIDLLNGELAVKRYEDMFPAFSDSRECKLIKTLINKLENGDIDGFTEAIRVYESISRLDKWFIDILLKIKKQSDSELDMK
jgi:alpha-soluble NSF attachment protein